MFDKKEVDNVNILVCKIGNYGNLPITKQDYDEPLTLSYDLQTEVTDSEVINANPSNLKVSISENKDNGKNYIQISPLLLNPGEEFFVKSVVINYKRNPVFNTRIIGGEVRLAKPKISKEIKSLIFVVIVMTLPITATGFLIGYTSSFIEAYFNTGSWVNYVGLIITSATILPIGFIVAMRLWYKLSE
jgi:hypothetical protein